MTTNNPGQRARELLAAELDEPFKSRAMSARDYWMVPSSASLRAIEKALTPTSQPELVERVADALAKLPCRSANDELDLLRRREAARAALSAAALPDERAYQFADEIIHWMNATDSSEMTVQQFRSALNMKLLSMGTKEQDRG